MLILVNGNSFQLVSASMLEMRANAVPDAVQVCIHHEYPSANRVEVLIKANEPPATNQPTRDCCCRLRKRNYN